MNLFSWHRRTSFKDALHRIDRVAGDLNVLLVVIAIGLATLDFTFLLTQKVIDRLPPVTRITYETRSQQAEPTRAGVNAPAAAAPQQNIR
jgi:hypothetical protein